MVLTGRRNKVKRIVENMMCTKNKDTIMGDIRVRQARDEPDNAFSCPASDDSFTGHKSSRPPLLFTERRLKCKRENLVLPLLPARKGRKAGHDPCRVKTVAKLT